MAKKTPPIGAKGRYTLKSPWVANPGVLYECEAIRSFDDIYQLGSDVYNEYYLPMGLMDGADFEGTPFSFSTEKSLDPNIITLRGSDGTFIYVPDTYILSYPSMDGVRYSRMVISIDLGSLPDYVDLGPLKTSLANLAQQVIGAVPDVDEHRAASTNQPTALEHDALEAARVAAISITQTDHQKYLQEVQKNALKTQTIAALVSRLQQLGDLPPS